ncbi:hypothetical protein F4679DRAFT_539969 [Xylaria curta]|nr:hypothetical protein F4679DRAFT_539969 [Xylaria curta]
MLTLPHAFFPPTDCNMSTPSLCSGTNRDGRRCRNYPCKGTSVCFQHRPRLALPIRNRAATSNDVEDQQRSNMRNKGMGSTFQGNDNSNQYNSLGADQNNVLGSGSQFPRAKIKGDVNITSREGNTIEHNTANSNNNTIIQQLPKATQLYHSCIFNFASNNLRGFDFNYEELAAKAADLANSKEAIFDIDPVLAPKIIKLGVYDFIILCDNSRSMKSKKQVLGNTLKRLAKVASVFTRTGVSIRFLNHGSISDKDLNNLSPDDIKQRVEKVQFKKGSKLGTALKAKIVDPIIEEAQSQKLKRPVIVTIITDGEPHGEPSGTLRDAIYSCKRSEAIQSYGCAAVLFVVARIGKSESAERFLNELESDEKIKGMVYCSADGLNKQQELPPSGESDKENITLVIELLLAALPE